eukprot:comp21867_c0_seq1/m.49521 comp21867_c0_seq1/g.49521  ORF comp21867_c0_seq1/g.49521 comp21867_c0_seq1/m.49521 type:complete len:506 (-) comp21867_c0_seq1:803-2320(-)
MYCWIETLLPRRASGTSERTFICERSASTPQMRARITTLRAMSVPFRSSRGSGSVYPRRLASATTAEKDTGAAPARAGLNWLNRKDRVPEKMPSILWMRSPVSIRSRSVLRMGSPAPTVASCMHSAGPASDAAWISRQSWIGPENAFLFGVAIEMPWRSHSGYRAAMVSLLVQSSSTGVPESSVAAAVIPATNSSMLNALCTMNTSSSVLLDGDALTLPPRALGWSHISRELALPATWILRGEPRICESNAAPTFPAPIRPTTTSLLSEKRATGFTKKFSMHERCTPRIAFFSSAWSITSEMLRSLEPCAIARMFTLAAPRAAHTAPATPGVWLMPSPTTASTEQLLRTSIDMSCRVISRKNSWLRTSRDVSAASVFTAKQIECSDDAWAMKITETCTRRRQPKSRSETPGMPTIPLPSRLIRATEEMVAMPLMHSGVLPGRPAATAAACAELSDSPGRSLITVKPTSGLNVLRTMSGMPSLTAGAIVCGCSTLAPKLESSMASL